MIQFSVYARVSLRWRVFLTANQQIKQSISKQNAAVIKSAIILFISVNCKVLT